MIAGAHGLGADGASFLSVGFSCPAPHQPGNCEVFVRPVKSGFTSRNAFKPGSGMAVPFSAAHPFAGQLKLRVLVDTSVVEVYAQGGRAIETLMYIPPSAADVGVSLLSAAGEGVAASIAVHSMGSAYASTDSAAP